MRIGTWILIGMGVVLAGRAAFASAVPEAGTPLDPSLALRMEEFEGPWSDDFLAPAEESDAWDFSEAPDKAHSTVLKEETEEAQNTPKASAPAPKASAAVPSSPAAVPPPRPAGVEYRVRTGEALWKIARRHRVSIDAIVRHNPGMDPDAIRAGARIFLPGVDRAIPPPSRFLWPVQSSITSGFGRRRHPILHSVRYHLGIDIAAPSGSTVRAAGAGRVTQAGWVGGYGYLVEIDHGNGYRTRYAHNSKLLVRRGQKVARGEAIARVGSTGYSTGPHLHFEVRKNGRAVNPIKHLP